MIRYSAKLIKMMLYTAVYHHHKVRTVECMFKSIFETLMEPENEENILSPRLKLKNPTDLLRIDESAFLTITQEEPLVSEMVTRIVKRDLLRRSLQIASRHVENEDSLINLMKLGDRMSRPLQALRRRIFNEIRKKYQTSVADLWVDLPRGPRLAGEAQRCWIQFGSGKNLEVETLLDIFPLDRWLESYEQNKWRGHVFYTGEDEYLTAANRAARKVLSWRPFHIGFKDSATWACKLDI